MGALIEPDLVAAYQADGAVVVRQAFTPAQVDLARTAIEANLVNDIRWGFQGSYTDSDTALVNMGTRWFDTAGAFTARDTWSGSAASPVTLNRYAYGNNNPLGHTDPDGRCARRIDGQFCVPKYKSSKSKPKPKPKPRPVFSKRAAENRNVAPRPAAKPNKWKPTKSFLAANGVAPKAPPKWSPSASFLAINGVAPSSKPRPPVKAPATKQAHPPIYAGGFCVSFCSSGLDGSSPTAEACIVEQWCNGRQLTHALQNSDLGTIVFAAIDVAHEGNVDKIDGNWSPKDLEAAVDGSGLEGILTDFGFSATAANEVAGITGSVADRLIDSNSIYEEIDQERTWLDRNKGKIVSALTIIADVTAVVSGVVCLTGNLAACGISKVASLSAAGLGGLATQDACSGDLGSGWCRTSIASNAVDFSVAAMSPVMAALANDPVGGAFVTVAFAPVTLGLDSAFAVDAWMNNPFAYSLPSETELGLNS